MFENEYWSLWEESGVELPKIKTPRKASIKSKNLEGLQEFLGNCKRCKLCKERNKIVFGSGNPKARLMFIGEGPGADEDAQGLPFVGRAGHLLTKIIEAMGLTRNDVYIANIVKCRPPSNRVPEPDEIDQCLPFLKAQIDLVAPEMVVALGLTAARALTQTEHNMGNLRGQFHQIAFLLWQ